MDWFDHSDDQLIYTVALHGGLAQGGVIITQMDEKYITFHSKKEEKTSKQCEL